MGWWQVNADTLAGSRFVLSPLAETFASLKALRAGTAAHPGERTWLEAHLPGYGQQLAADPVTAALVRAGLGPEWIADFLTPTPRGEEDFETEVARVRGTSPEAARAHLSMALRGPLPSSSRTATTSPTAPPTCSPTSGPRPYAPTGPGAVACSKPMSSPAPPS